MDSAYTSTSAESLRRSCLHVNLDRVVDRREELSSRTDVCQRKLGCEQCVATVPREGSGCDGTGSWRGYFSQILES